MSSLLALRMAVMPRSMSIAQSHSDVSFPVGSLSRLPLPLLGVVCGWLTCVDLLNLFRANRVLVAAHHLQPLQHPQVASSVSASQWLDWVSCAWRHAHLSAPLTESSPERTAPFSHCEWCGRPSTWCRLALLATPYLRHLSLWTHVDRSQPVLADLADVLDLLPRLSTLEVTGTSDDCTNTEQLYIPLRLVLARHPRLHALRCCGNVDLSHLDLLAIAAHPALAHLTIGANLHVHEEERYPVSVELSFPEYEDDIEGWFLDKADWHDDDEPGSHTSCTAHFCSLSSSVSARAGLLRHVKMCWIAEHGTRCPRWTAEIDKQIGGLESETQQGAEGAQVSE